MSDRVDWPGEWPPEDREYLGRCPICGKTSRTLLFDDLIDVNQRCAPGRWTLWRCNACNSGYLDPRPSEQSVVRAYATYPTHRAGNANENTRTGMRRFAAMARNSYINRRYGTHRQPTSPWAWLLMSLLPPPLRLEWDHYMRHLPRAVTGCNRLLDIGCGNGDFLLRAKDAGWEVFGLDFDATAVHTARSRGLDVQLGRIENYPYPPASFDVVTANHVIEHVHDPIGFLRACWRLVKPGGRLWIGTPNLTTPLVRHFGIYWTMLDVPRHLILFNAFSLTQAFVRAGIGPPHYKSRGWCVAWVMQDSHNIRRGALANATQRVNAAIMLRSVWYELITWLHPHRGVEMIAIATKPA